MKTLHIADRLFNDQCWQAYYALLEILRERYESPMARIGWEQTKESFLSLMEIDPGYHRFVIFDGQTAVGWADFDIHAKGMPGQNASVRVESVYDHAPKAFECIVAAELLNLMKMCSSNSARLWTTTERIAAIARHWSGRELNRLDRFRLYRAKAPTALMESWLKKIPQEHPGLRLEFFSPVPDEHLVAYTSLFIKYIREMPTERESGDQFLMTADEVRRDMEWRLKNRMHTYTYALFDPNSTMIGYTNVMINEADPSDVFQSMTGLDVEYRGRGLSRWLKAAMFFKVGEDFPANETITTDMRGANAPIQKVNAEMGYVLLSSGNEFEISADDLH